MGSHVKMLFQLRCKAKLEHVNVRLATQFFGLFLVLYKLSIGLWHLVLPQDHGLIKKSYEIFFGVGLVCWGLMDIMLIFGAYKKSRVIVKVWIFLNLALIGMVFALMGLWHMSVCTLVFAITLFFGIATMKKIEDESSNNYTEMKNTDEETII